MGARVRRFLSLLFAILIAGSLFGGGSLAAAVYDAVNADKVDGRHAVGAGASSAQRANKLVATNAAGRLPNNIIAKALDAGLLDGHDSSVFQKQLTGACTATEKMTGVGTDAAVMCSADLVDGGDAATLNGIQSSDLQRRVTGTCAIGQMVRAIAADGTVTCGVDQIDGGNATTIDGIDSTGLQRAGVRTVIVSPTGTAAANGSALTSALAQIPNSGGAAPSATNRWLLKVEPGTYDVTAAPLTMRSFVDIEGSGTATVVTCACGGSPVTAANNTSLRDLKIVNSGTGTGTAVGIFAFSATADLHRLVIEVSSGGAAWGVFGSGALSIRDSSITVQAVDAATGLVLNEGTHEVIDSDIGVTGGASNATTIQPQDGDTTVRGSSFTVGGAAGTNTALYALGGEITLTDSSLVALPTAGAALRSLHGAGATVRVATSLLDGPVVGLAPQCVHNYNAAYAVLNGACQP